MLKANYAKLPITSGSDRLSWKNFGMSVFAFYSIIVVKRLAYSLFAFDGGNPMLGLCEGVISWVLIWEKRLTMQ